MANHGTEFSTRWKLMRERVEAMKAIWTQEVAEYHGEMVDFTPMRSWPKPIQKPHPPVILGGSGPNILKRVVAYADGWMPNRGDVLGRINELRELARAAGRGDIPVTVYPKATKEDIDELQRAGIDRCIWYLPSDGRDRALARLADLQKLTRPYR
jgi:alkanesulfonate monooxygenase SsuD/methylene tetrahydromethanopterin reductase-like flavin-dependent oxidoreductase (luciferase family)